MFWIYPSCEMAKPLLRNPLTQCRSVYCMDVKSLGAGQARNGWQGSVGRKGRHGKGEWGVQVWSLAVGQKLSEVSYSEVPSSKRCGSRSSKQTIKPYNTLGSKHGGGITPKKKLQHTWFHILEGYDFYSQAWICEVALWFGFYSQQLFQSSTSQAT